MTSERLRVGRLSRWAALALAALPGALAGCPALLSDFQIDGGPATTSGDSSSGSDSEAGACANECTLEALRCQGNAVQACVLGGRGCAVWGATAACDGGTCVAGHCTMPAVCGDGIVEVGETCDQGGATDPLCENCQTSEIQLSPASSYPGGPSPPSLGGRGNPSFLWPTGNGDLGYFFALFSDHTGSPSRQQVSMSVRGDSLASVTDLGTAVQSGSLFLPNNPAQFPPQPQPDDQSHPAAALLVGAIYFVVFEDDNTTPPNEIDVHLRSMDASLNANQVAPCGVNGSLGAGEPGVQSAPRMAAGPGDVLFIVWQSESLQTVNGVTYKPPTSASGCGTLGTQVLIGTGSAPAVAATPQGWVVTWQDGLDVKWAPIGPTGMPSRSGQAVSSQPGQQSLPAIASSNSDGSFAIAWTAPSAAGTSAIFAQRFEPTQTATTGDDTSPVNNLTMGAETSPAIAYTAAAGGAYVVAWVDAGSPSQVRARLVAESGGSLGDGSGYLDNIIDGTNSEFPVSTTAGRMRANPTVVVGGSGPCVAFGWEDQSAAAGSAQPGIIGRRFPPPTQ